MLLRCRPLEMPRLWGITTAREPISLFITYQPKHHSPYSFWPIVIVVLESGLKFDSMINFTLSVHAFTIISWRNHESCFKVCCMQLNACKEDGFHQHPIHQPSQLYIGNEERNYHAFYQLCAGATPEEKKKYSLETAEKYKFCPFCIVEFRLGREGFQVCEKSKQTKLITQSAPPSFHSYLSRGNCFKADGIADESLYKEMMRVNSSFVPTFRWWF